MENNIHIGKLIEKRVRETGISNSQFALLMNCHRTTVNNIYKQSTIDLAKLQKICKVLDYDFFKHYITGSNCSESKVISKRIEFTSDEIQKIAENDKVVVEVLVHNK